MIARICREAIPTSKSGECVESARSIALPRYLATPGNRGSWYLYRGEGDVTRSVMITLWDDVDALAALTGIDCGSLVADHFSSSRSNVMERSIQEYEVHSDNPQGAHKSGRTPSLEDSPMVARLWRGVVPNEKADAYWRYLYGFGVRDYEKYVGYRSGHLLRRTEQVQTHILLLSFWTSRQAIMTYAGSNIDRAHYYAYDLECLIDPSLNVEHYEVVVGLRDLG